MFVSYIPNMSRPTPIFRSVQQTLGAFGRNLTGDASPLIVSSRAFAVRLFSNRFHIKTRTDASSDAPSLPSFDRQPEFPRVQSISALTCPGDRVSEGEYQTVHEQEGDAIEGDTGVLHPV